MENRTAAVDRFMDTLQHPRKAAVQQLRLAILDSDPEITEHVKWNAPSFCYRGVDRVTFRLQPRDSFELIIHRGVKVRSDTAGFVFDDDASGLRWITRDRAVLALDDLLQADAGQDRVVALARRWMEVD